MPDSTPSLVRPVLAAALTVGALLTTGLPAVAAAGPHSGPGSRPGVSQRLGPSALTSLRQRQARLAARPAPVFDRAGSRTFTVTTTEDAPLGSPTDTHCVDGLSGRCSLRAAVEAADNLATPVRIVLGRHTYPLTTITQLTVTDPDGISIVGQGPGRTAIAGDGSGLFELRPAAGAAEGGALFLSSVKLEHGTAGDGGAVHLDPGSSTLSLDRVVATHNTASNQGGAIYADDYNAVFVSRSSLTHNSAPTGGAIYSYWADLRLSGSTMSGNTAAAGSGEGGALYNEYGVVRVTDGSISGNTAGDATHPGHGGAISDHFGDVLLTGVRLDGNSATDGGGGGAVSTFADLFAIDHGSLSHNHVTGASSQGGAIHERGDSQLDLHHVGLVGNSAGSATRVGFGGAIAISGGHLTDHGSRFSDNRAPGDLGSGGAVYDGSTSSSRFVGSRFTGNTAGPTAGGNGFGGAVYTSDEGGTAFEQVTMTGNKAATYGGAVYGDASAYSISVDRSTLSGNRAGSSGTAGSGGAVFATDAVVTVDNSTFTGNRAVSVPGQPGQGGALWVGGSRLGLHFSTLAGNVAEQGGAIYTKTLGGGTLVGSIVSGNRTSPTGSEQDCSVEPGYPHPDSRGGNVLGRARCVTRLAPSDTVSRRVHLDGLRDNGGPTRTMAITASSPAVGRASSLVPATDQRGRRRPSRHADSGAYELASR